MPETPRPPGETVEDGFGFVTKDFVKPTAEGRQFINWHSHHPKATFKSILFREAVGLRRLNDYSSSLNQLKEKTIRSNFPLDMTDGMITMASSWENRLRPQKCDKKDDLRVWATSFAHMLTPTEKK